MRREDIETALRDYHWMIKEIARLRSFLQDAGEGLIAQYGIEATLPNPKGGNTDPVSQEAGRRERKWKRLAKLEKKVLLIQDRIDLIMDEREKTVLECMLDGMSLIAISKHMGLSRRHIHRIKNEIIDKMSHMSQMSHMTHKLRNDKVCV